MNVYFISGLASDRRVFRNILLPPQYHAVYLDWIPPLKNETLGEYALRMASGIDRAEPFALIGLSMGGMLAVEIAKTYHPATTILISSVPSPEQLPSWYRLAGMLHLQRMLPVRTIKSLAIVKRLFTAETKEDKQLLKQVIQESDDELIRWSVNAILNWRSGTPPRNYTHIHGAGDRVLPLRFTRPTHIIRGAGHLLVLNRAAAVNGIIEDVLSNGDEERRAAGSGG